ncbi:class II aldolase/adducin family protein [Patulibacter sp. NPDC049589]|uniref:class II aldolase/adducin family protein n=1 Tax=Patulibacter sp. NPDC049589 TaxID=3154731 RepID=UPI0034220C7B
MTGLDASPTLETLVVACRILEHQGLTSAFGHVTSRLDDTEDVLISGSVGPGLVGGAQDVVRVGPGGDVRGGDASLLPGEAAVHLGILRARRDVTSVVRYHGPSSMAWGTLGRPLPATTGMGLFLGHEVPVFETSSTVTTPEHGDRLAAALGDGPAILMRGFGSVTVGRTIEEAVARAWLLERSAAAVLAAYAVATPLPYPASAAAPFASDEGPAPRQLARVWHYLQAISEGTNR